jgi:pimeloyl-ACP methyl ester carboxylesterase
MSVQPSPFGKPRIVLAHGAFAESASWNGVIGALLAEGYPVLAAAIPMRGVRSDAQYLASVLAGIEGNLVLVGHSYGGAVITNAATGNDRVQALVFVGGFAPETWRERGGIGGSLRGRHARRNARQLSLARR